jgi:hypothetical protein
MHGEGRLVRRSTPGVKSRALLLAVAVAVAANGCAGAGQGPGGASDNTPPEQVRGPRLALELPRLDGRPLDVRIFRGRAVLLVAFLMDNLGSHALLRNAEQVAQAHPDDVVVVAISGDHQQYVAHERFDQRAILLQSFARVLNLQRTHVVVADDAVRSGESPLGAIRTVPTVFLVNRAGVLARRIEGYLTVPQLERLVGPAVPPSRR